MRSCNVFRNQFFQLCNIFRMCHLAESNQCFIQLGVQVAFFVQYIGNTATHTGCKVLAGLAEDDRTATGHIFTTMVAHAFYDNGCTGVPDAEPFASNTSNKRLTAGCTEQSNITNNNIFICLEFRILWRIDNQCTAGKSLSEVVVAVALQLKRQALWNECTETLSARAFALQCESIFFQCVIILPCDFCPEQCSQCPVQVADIQL